MNMVPGSIMDTLFSTESRLFNIYAVAEKGRVDHLKIRCYDTVRAPLEKRISILEKNNKRDFGDAVPEDVPEIFKRKDISGNNGPEEYALTLDEYRNMMRNGEGIDMYGKAFSDLKILENSVFIATLVVDGIFDNEKILYC